jgi:hypothetical protein
VDLTGVKPANEAILKAFRSALTGGGSSPLAGTIDFPCGTYNLNATVTFTSNYMVILNGSGGCADFIWTGDNKSPMFLVQDCNKCLFENFRVVAKTPLLYVFQTENSGLRVGLPTADQFKNLMIEGPNGNIVTAFYFHGPSDNNNDQQKLESVQVYGYSHSAFTLDGFNVFDVVFDHCTFSGGGYGQYGVESLHGNFHWLNGDGGGNTRDDFYVSSPGAGGYDIIGGHFEMSAQFLGTGGPAGSVTVYKVRNITFGGECLGNSANEIKNNKCSPHAGDAILFRFPGVLNIQSSQFGEVVPVPPLTMCFANTRPEMVSVEDSVFGTSNTTAATLFRQGCTAPERFLNNMYLTSNGTYGVYSDSWATAQTLPEGTTIGGKPPLTELPGGSITCPPEKHLIGVSLTEDGKLSGSCN